MRITPGILSTDSLFALIAEAAAAGIEIEFIDESEPRNGKLVCTRYVEIYNNYRIDQAYREIENKLHELKIKRNWFDTAKRIYNENKTA